METTNLDIYGHPPIPWSRAEQLLEEAVGGMDGHFFLATARPDGRPMSQASAPCGSTAG